MKAIYSMRIPDIYDIFILMSIYSIYDILIKERYFERSLFIYISRRWPKDMRKSMKNVLLTTIISEVKSKA